MKQNRIMYLDLGRGMMIVWMLIVHISMDYGLLRFGEPIGIDSPFLWMSFFMFPFYFYSGYLFSDKKKTKDFILDKAKSLLTPFFVFTVLGIALYQCYTEVTEGTFKWGVLKTWLSTGTMQSNAPLWFLTSLFFVNTIYFLLKKRIGGEVVALPNFSFISWSMVVL